MTNKCRLVLFLKNGNTALHHAAAGRYIDVVKALLSCNGVSLHKNQVWKIYILHAHVQYDHLKGYIECIVVCIKRNVTKIVSIWYLRTLVDQLHGQSLGYRIQSIA